MIDLSDSLWADHIKLHEEMIRLGGTVKPHSEKPRFKDYFNEHVPEKYQIHQLRSGGGGYVTDGLDWNIIGEQAKNCYSFLCDAKVYAKYYKPNKKADQNLRYKHSDEVQELLIWLENNIFDKLHVNSRTTEYVLLTIARSKLNRLDLPEEISGNICVSMFACYQIRKSVFDNYLLNVIQEVPF